jgi:hypothetical protein
MNGGSPKPLTPALRAHGLFQGYFDAWRLPSGLYLQADNSHDTLSIVRQSADGSERTIQIPGSAGISDGIDTALGSRLLVDTGSGVSSTSSMFWYNPRYPRNPLRLPDAAQDPRRIRSGHFRLPGRRVAARS